jgi:tetratricopeptide (TPR) repeat protein
MHEALPEIDPHPSFSSPLPPDLYRAPGAPRIEDEGEYEGDYIPPKARRRRRVGGWVVFLVLALGAGATGAAWLKQRGGGRDDDTGKASRASDLALLERLSKFESALSISDFPTEKKELDGLVREAPTDTRTLVARARLTNREADLVWLGERAATDSSERARKRAELKPWHEALRADSDAALRAGPNDATALRARLDALRILGERDAARALVARIPATPGDADAPYVLAALDMAEPEPLWPGITDRLRAAAALEPTPGRARAALVLSLATTGNASAARLELDRVAENPRLGALVVALRRYVERHDDGPTALAADAGRDAAKVPTGGPLPEDPKRLVAEAAAAIQRGDVERARLLYTAALVKNGADSEALAGLGDVERANGNATKAKEAYRRALQVNPSYLSALVALGDLEWDGGDRASALRVYKDISDRFPDSAYPARVRERVASGSPAPPASTAVPTAAPTSAPPTSAAPTDPPAPPSPPLPPPTASTADTP